MKQIKEHTTIREAVMRKHVGPMIAEAMVDDLVARLSKQITENPIIDGLPLGDRFIIYRAKLRKRSAEIEGLRKAIDVLNRWKAAEQVLDDYKRSKQ